MQFWHAGTPTFGKSRPPSTGQRFVSGLRITSRPRNRMRNISFTLTTAAVRERRKTVTRRLGWTDKLKPGDILQAVEKAQGLKKGEHVKPICLIRVVSVHAEQLATVYADR